MRPYRRRVGTYNTEARDTVVRNKAIRRRFRGVGVQDITILMLILISMPNLILLMSSAPYHEINQRLKINNWTNRETERDAEKERVQKPFLKYIIR